MTRSATTAAPPPAAYDYESVTDDTGQIQVAVPTAWTDRNTAPFDIDDGVQVPYIAASTDLDGVHQRLHRARACCSPSSRRRPTSTPRSPPTASPGVCTDGGITDYCDPVFTGKYQVWQDCGGTTTDVVTLVAVPADASYLAVIQAQIVTDADLDALQQAFDTFNTVS